MINKKINNERGISLVSLAITVAILLILGNVLAYNISDNLKLEKLNKMQNDIENLRDKISSYYSQNGKIPANIQYTNINQIKEAGVISTAVDTGEFLVIDLSAIENLTLNYGQDFEKVKQNVENVNNYTDLYIINSASHNIFYVEGIKVDNDVFYTNYTAKEIDTMAVDLRYVDNIKIPDGYYYVSGTKETGIHIKSNDNTKEYIWVVNSSKIDTLPSNVNVATSEKEDFVKSVNGYNGYYKSTSNNDVIYLPIENWSLVYDKEGTYQDKNGDIAYIPQGFQVSLVPDQNTIDGGLVVRDSKNNEWVWIEVPKSIYSGTTTNTSYTAIETAMQNYAKDYRENGYTDRFYSIEQHGFANATEYNNWKNSMLKSVYEKGGFYIGRYEMGTQTRRTTATATLTTPEIKQGLYPYNYITCSQAQTKAKELSTQGKQASLMFGIQWDLVMKFIEEKAGKTQSELKTDSSTWGNYRNVEFEVNRGKYLNGATWYTITSYNKSNSTEEGVLLTTGATNRNSTLNIYDLAGNVYEWTLDKPADTTYICISRGGRFGRDGNVCPANYRTKDSISNMDSFLGYRSVLW